MRQRRRTDVEPVPVPSGAAVGAATVARQIEQALLEARAIGFAFRRLSGQAPVTLAWRCERVGDAIIEGLRDAFGDGVL